MFAFHGRESRVAELPRCRCAFAAVQGWGADFEKQI